MRTTVDFPIDLFRRAKARAASRGESLKTLITRAVTAEVGTPRGTATRGRVPLPLFGAPKGRSVDLRGSDLARALAAEDALRARRRTRR